jgi:hypothetical protein
MPILDYFFKRKNYELFVSHYFRGQTPDLQAYPFHRAIFLKTEFDSDPARGTLYQLVPTGPEFRYFRQTNVTVSLPDSFAGVVKIGDVRPGDLLIVETILSKVPVETTDPYVAGPDWCRDAVRRLAKGGFVDLSLLAKLNPKLEEQQDDYMFHVLREQSTPVCPLYEALAQTKYPTAGFSHATVTDCLFTDPRAVTSF